MTELSLTFACLDYDRTRALQDGRVRPEGIDLRSLRLPVEETFFRQLRNREFDVSEISLSSYVLTLDLPQPPFVALPVFPSRYFRHQTMFVNERSGIRRPEDLVGRRVGIPEFQMTASVWQRGILRDEHGVPTESMRYFTGGLEQPGRDEKIPLTLPDSLSVTPIGPDRTLSAMLVDGELDAIFCANEPSCFGRDPHVVRLFPDYKAVEQDYFRRTRIFPIMHVVVLKREVFDAEPWVATSLTKAFQESLDLSYEDIRYRSALKTMLPWLSDHLAETEAVMGRDFWQYGVAPNHDTLDRFLGYSYDQGLAARRRTPEELFYPGAADSYKL